MLKKNMEEALNNQINAEIYSSYLYYSMAAYFESKSLEGFAHWMYVQAMEEMMHAHKFFAYINDRGGRVVLKAIDQPKSEWASPLQVFEESYEHETKVTGLINNLVDLAIKESDHASVNFLHWFVGEQVEEEANADTIVNKLKMVEKVEGGIFMLDQELANRPMLDPQGILDGTE